MLGIRNGVRRRTRHTRYARSTTGRRQRFSIAKCQQTGEIGVRTCRDACSPWANVTKAHDDPNLISDGRSEKTGDVGGARITVAGLPRLKARRFVLAAGTTRDRGSDTHPEEVTMS